MDKDFLKTPQPASLDVEPGWVREIARFFAAAPPTNRVPLAFDPRSISPFTQLGSTMLILLKELQPLATGRPEASRRFVVETARPKEINVSVHLTALVPTLASHPKSNRCGVV